MINFAYNTETRKPENRSLTELTTHRPYLTLTGKLKGVYCILEKVNHVLTKLCYGSTDLSQYTISVPNSSSNWKFMKSHFPRTTISVVKLFCKFAQSTAMILLCSVQNFRTIWQLNSKLWANNLSQDLGLWCSLDGYPTLQQTPGCHDCNQYAKIKINNNALLLLQPFTVPEAELIAPNCDRSWTFMTLRRSTMPCCHNSINHWSVTYICWA